MSYTDVFVVPVLHVKKDAYKQVAELAQQVWRDHGALSYVELQADDVQPGKATSFPQSVALTAGEFVVVAFITYRDRAHGDQVGAKAMQDPRMAGLDPKLMPFDTRRMFWGGFKPFVGQVQPAVQPYLFFRGRCEEAIQYYKERLGAEVLMMLRFKEHPVQPGQDKLPSVLAERIMHATIRIHGTEIMVADGMRSGPLDFQCMSLSLAVATEAEADRVFNVLAADGKVEMPIGKTFFSPRFGSVVDTFGVAWMVMVRQAMPS